MTVTESRSKIGIASRLVNGVLAIDPLANFAKNRARKMMVKRAEAIGVPWRENVARLSDRDWSIELARVKNPHLEYPDYYKTSFHAYEAGNLSWQAAWEVESAALAVHAKIWSDGDANGDAMLRQSYHQVIQQAIAPRRILDLGCGVGMSTVALQKVYPQAEVTGIDLSPYFLAVAEYRARQSPKHNDIDWIHGAAEATGLPNGSFDLVSACLLFHELPTTAAEAIITEARRLLNPRGYLAIMDMNPNSAVFKKMPPYILTLLKSTEPYLDQYFALDIDRAFTAAGFASPDITINSPRHRTILAKVA